MMDDKEVSGSTECRMNGNEPTKNVEHPNLQ